MANVIVHAEKEVFFATKRWDDSIATKYITNAIRELNRRAGQRGVRIVMKFMYDHDTPRQILRPYHRIVTEETYSGKGLRLPAPSEIPNISLEAMNYRQPIMGTFHSKFVLVDRKVALIASNNIRDLDNVEMMVHFEGPIVDSFYDMALLSWDKKLEPPLPTRSTPAAAQGSRLPEPANPMTVEATAEDLTELVTEVVTEAVAEAVTAAVAEAVTETVTEAVVEDVEEPMADAVEEVPNDTGEQETPQEVPQDVLSNHGGTSRQPENDALSDTVTIANDPPTENNGDDTVPLVPPNSVVLESVQQKRSEIRPNQPNGPDAETQAFLDSGKQTAPDWYNHQPPPSESEDPQSTLENPQYDDQLEGEVRRVEASLLPRTGETAMDAVTRLLNHTATHISGDAPQFAKGDEMTPYIVHDTQKPFPMAMLNRPPYGALTHKSIVQPQNAAWLSALRHAQKNVFIQTPTLNADAFVPAIRDACERGVDVICYASLGYDDTGELLPRQGGTNEMVAFQLYRSLSDYGRSHLHYFWYVAKDQTRPISKIRRCRDCHLKMMIIDESVGIVGSGNQDTQSWYHSQEINVMVDSPEVCKSWIDGVRRNQNTHIYGMLEKDGIWRDSEGYEAEGSLGVNPGRFGWIKSIWNTLRKDKELKQNGIQ